MSSKVRSRGWCFTLNNYTGTDIESIKSIENCKYIFQEETGEKKTKHLQSFIYFDNARSFTSLKKLLPKAHLEAARNKAASIKYCSKEDTRTGKIYANFDYDYRDWETVS